MTVNHKRKNDNHHPKNHMKQTAPNHDLDGKVPPKKHNRTFPITAITAITANHITA